MKLDYTQLWQHAAQIVLPYDPNAMPPAPTKEPALNPFIIPAAIAAVSLVVIVAFIFIKRRRHHR